MPEPLCFVSGQTPSLLYATKQIVAASAVTRAVHRHARFTEMLYVYQGAGQYVAGGYSYAIRTGMYCCIIRAICMRSPRPCTMKSALTASVYPICGSAGWRRVIFPTRNMALCGRRRTRSTIFSRSAS